MAEFDFVTKQGADNTYAPHGEGLVTTDHHHAQAPESGLRLRYVVQSVEVVDGHPRFRFGVDGGVAFPARPASAGRPAGVAPADEHTPRPEWMTVGAVGWRVCIGVHRDLSRDPNTPHVQPNPPDRQMPPAVNQRSGASFALCLAFPA